MDNNLNLSNDDLNFISINLSAIDLPTQYIGENRGVSFTVYSHEPYISYGCNNDLPYYLADLAHDAAVVTCFDFCLLYMVLRGKGFSGIAIVVTGMQHF